MRMETFRPETLYLTPLGKELVENKNTMFHRSRKTFQPSNEQNLSYLNHRRCLHIGQFLDASLSGHDITHLDKRERERANTIVASINVQYLLLVVNRCVFVLDRLVDTGDEDIGVSCDVSRRNISPPYIPLFDQFPVEEEI